MLKTDILRTALFEAIFLTQRNMYIKLGRNNPHILSISRLQFIRFSQPRGTICLHYCLEKNFIIKSMGSGKT